ncbi:MAG: ABC transporter permease [Thermoprotei archaeon]
MLKFIPREDVTLKFIIMIYSMAFVFALIIYGLILMVAGFSPFLAYGFMFYNVFLNPYGISNTIIRSSAIMLSALGLAIAYKAGIFTIGSEGQIYVGAVLSTWTAFTFAFLPPPILITLMMIMSFIAGAFWAFIPGVMRALINANEVISTLMMNYIAILIVRYLVYGPWKDPKGYGFPITPVIPSSAMLPLIPYTNIHIMPVIGLFIGVILAYMMKYTRVGYEIKVFGDNPEAARYSGISSIKVILIVMIISGGLAGLGGMGEVAGFQHRLISNISPGYGYMAIIVVWLARLNPLVTIISSILFGGMLVGADALQTRFSLPISSIYTFEALVLMLVLIADLLSKYKLVVR